MATLGRRKVPALILVRPRCGQAKDTRAAPGSVGRNYVRASGRGALSFDLPVRIAHGRQETASCTMLHLGFLCLPAARSSECNALDPMRQDEFSAHHYTCSCGRSCLVAVPGMLSERELCDGSYLHVG